MIKNNKYYKSSDFLKEDYKEIMASLFNPYGYNLESTLNYEDNSDLKAMKSKNHSLRKIIKK